MSCCDELFKDLASGNRQIAAKSIKWDDAVIFGLAAAVTTWLSGGTAPAVAIAGGGSAAGDFVGQNKDVLGDFFAGTLNEQPMTEERWAFALINNSNELYVGNDVSTSNQPLWGEGIEEGSWKQFWGTETGQELKGTYGRKSARIGNPIEPDQWEFWQYFGDGTALVNERIDPSGKKEIGLAYLEYLYGEDMMRFIDVDNVDLQYINLLNYARNTMNPQMMELFANSSTLPFQLGEVPPEGTVYMPSGTFDTLVQNPMLLNLVNSSFVEGGEFADLALQFNNIGRMDQQSPMFNMILQTMLDSEGDMKNILVDNIFSTEDGEGSNLFDQAIDRAVNRAMGFDPETQLNPLAFDGMDPADFADLYPDETYQTPSLQSIVDVNSIKADIKKELDTAGYIKKSAVRTMISEAIGGIVHPEAICTCGDGGSEPYSDTPDDLSNDGPC